MLSNIVLNSGTSTAAPLQGSNQIGNVGNRKIFDAVRLPIMPNIPKDVYKFKVEEVAKAEEWRYTLIGVVVGARVSRKILVDLMTRLGGKFAEAFH